MLSLDFLINRNVHTSNYSYWMMKADLKQVQKLDQGQLTEKGSSIQEP